MSERMLPAFSAQGIDVGNFTMYPGLTVQGIASSNILANDDRKVSTIGLLVRPQVTLRTDAAQYRFSVRGVGDFRRYARQTSENSEEALLAVDGEVLMSPLSRIYAGGSIGSLVLPRYSSDSPANAAKPLEYTQAVGNIGASIETGSFRISGRGDVAALRFRDAPAFDGGTLYTRDRDRERYQGQLRVDYALTPAVSVYVSGTANKIDYLHPFGPEQLDRDSSGFGAFVGSSFDLTDLIRGDVRLGYISQDFSTPGVPNISGLGALGTLLYFPTRLTTVTLRGESSVVDTGVPGSTGVLRQGGSVRVDHELRRYIMASVEAGYFRESYRGLPRQDDLPFLIASGTYLSRSHWNARLSYEFRQRSCECDASVTEFADHRLLAGLTFQY